MGLALIPEAIAFSIIAGVDPKVGLYASFIIAILTSIFGGRPGSISAATGAMALLMVNLVRDHGVDYLFAATFLTGVIQTLFGILKLGRQFRFVPRSVMLGYINALGVLIFWSQMPHLIGKPFLVNILAAFSLVIIYGLPRLTKVVPSPLVALVVMTLVMIIFKPDIPTVGDMGDLPLTLPLFYWPQVPLSWETLQIIFPYSVTLAIVGLLASFLTASLVDELTDTPSDKNQESKGQGIANIVTSFFGGMAGCGMIGQSVINIQSGGRGRLSTFWAGLFLLFSILVLGQWVRQTPMAVLAAIMIMVSIGTFRWSSIRNIPKIPRNETVVMITTMTLIIATSNFALGVGIGIIMSTVFFSRNIAQLVFVDKALSEDGSHCLYTVRGQIFFLSKEDFLAGFDFDEAVKQVTINLSQAHFWDQGSVVILDQIVVKFHRKGAHVDLVGLNDASATLVDRLSLYRQARVLENATPEINHEPVETAIR